MKQSRWMAGVVLAGICLITPGVRAQNAPPAPPGAAPASPAPPSPFPGAIVPRPGTAPPPAGTIPPGSQPGTTQSGTAGPAPPFAIPGVTTVMVFPFDNNTPYGGPALGQALADAVKRGMDASLLFSTVKFDRTSLLIQRAVAENPTIVNPAVQGVIDPVRGTVDQARAMQIAQRTGMQALLLGSIEEYTYDKAANKVTIVATAQILNAQTGEPLRTAGVTGTATGAPGADESTVAQAAATDVASRLLAGLAVPAAPQTKPKRHGVRQPPSQEQEGSRHHIPGWIPAGALLAIIVGAVR